MKNCERIIKKSLKLRLKKSGRQERKEEIERKEKRKKIKESGEV